MTRLSPQLWHHDFRLQRQCLEVHVFHHRQLDASLLHHLLHCECSWAHMAKDPVVAWARLKSGLSHGNFDVREQGGLSEVLFYFDDGLLQVEVAAAGELVVVSC